jgi:hypothetical protein
MQTKEVTWSLDAKTVELRLERTRANGFVAGRASLISTRHELRSLQERLSAKFRTVSTDWPALAILPGLRWIGDRRRTVPS